MKMERRKGESVKECLIAVLGALYTPTLLLHLVREGHAGKDHVGWCSSKNGIRKHRLCQSLAHDVRVVDTHARTIMHTSECNSGALLSRRGEGKEIKSAAEERWASSTPFFVSTDGMLCREANFLLKRLSQRISTRCQGYKLVYEHGSVQLRLLLYWLWPFFSCGFHTNEAILFEIAIAP